MTKQNREAKIGYKHRGIERNRQRIIVSKSKLKITITILHVFFNDTIKPKLLIIIF